MENNVLNVVSAYGADVLITALIVSVAYSAVFRLFGEKLPKCGVLLGIFE